MIVYVVMSEDIEGHKEDCAVFSTIEKANEYKRILEDLVFNEPGETVYISSHELDRMDRNVMLIKNTKDYIDDLIKTGFRA